MMATAPPPAVYAGVREIATTGTWYRELAPLRYDVTERYSTVRWRGRVATVHAATEYTVAAAPPAEGLVLTAETLDQDERVDANGSVHLLSYRRVTHAADLRRGGSGIRSSADVRTVDVAFTAGTTTIPASLTPHRETLPLAATMRRTELESGTYGTSTVVGTMRGQRRAPYHCGGRLVRGKRQRVDAAVGRTASASTPTVPRRPTTARPDSRCAT